jgi:hypothetical protein
LVQFFDNHDGTLSIFGTVLDHASNATAPSAISNLIAPDPFQIASIGRTLSYNDPQVGARALFAKPMRGGRGEGPQRRAAGQEPLGSVAQPGYSCGLAMRA